MDFAIPTGDRKTGQIPGLCQRIEKVSEHDSDTSFSWNPWNNLRVLGKETR